MANKWKNKESYEIITTFMKISKPVLFTEGKMTVDRS